jgi:hypothetical protein
MSIAMVLPMKEGQKPASSASQLDELDTIKTDTIESKLINLIDLTDLPEHNGTWNANSCST